MKNKVKQLLDFWEVYYPIILAFVSFLYSVSLWFTGNKLEGIFVGIWAINTCGINSHQTKKKFS